ncbi:MAG TPA: hypothetical protein VJY34_06510 [Roseiarcus sp.]|nr:hypothetical protein [Roseiarcus sp.]
MTMNVTGSLLLQTAIYCGVPAAIESFKIAEEVFEEMNKEGVKTP